MTVEFPYSHDTTIFAGKIHYFANNINAKAQNDIFTQAHFCALQNGCSQPAKHSTLCYPPLDLESQFAQHASSCVCPNLNAIQHNTQHRQNPSLWLPTLTIAISTKRRILFFQHHNIHGHHDNPNWNFHHVDYRNQHSTQNSVLFTNLKSDSK